MNKVVALQNIYGYSNINVMNAQADALDNAILQRDVARSIDKINIA